MRLTRSLHIWLLVGALALAAPVAGLGIDDDSIVVHKVQDAKQKISETTGGADIPVGGSPGGGEEGGDDPASGSDARSGFWAGLLDGWVASGAWAFGALALSFFGFTLASHYVHPREALENPQRAVLYGFIRGNPGVHLKQLSKEFEMKTSTVLWHIRKLERADLVRSSKANGFRVFYPVEGGVEAKKVSMALTALTNDNARRIFEFISAAPGTPQRSISDRLDLNPGTVRWHLRKLRDMGLVVEIAEDRNPIYYASELGAKAFQHASAGPLAAVPVVHAPAPAVAPQ